MKSRYIIHVHGPTLERNRAEGTNSPVVVVRCRRKPDEMRFCREARVLGRAEIVHKPEAPLSNTGGRAVAYIETDGPVVMRFDDRRPVTLP